MIEATLKLKTTLNIVVLGLCENEILSVLSRFTRDIKRRCAPIISTVRPNWSAFFARDTQVIFPFKTGGFAWGNCPPDESLPVYL